MENEIVKDWIKILEIEKIFKLFCSRKENFNLISQMRTRPQMIDKNRVENWRSIMKIKENFDEKPNGWDSHVILKKRNKFQWA